MSPFSESAWQVVRAMFVRRIRMSDLRRMDLPVGWFIAYKVWDRDEMVIAAGWVAWWLGAWQCRWRWLYRVCLVGAKTEGGYFVPSMGGYWAWPPAEYRMRNAKLASRGVGYSVFHGWVHR